MTWTPLLEQLLPYFGLCAFGLVLAIVRWRRHPGVSLIVVMACSIEIVTTLLGGALPLLPTWFTVRGGTNAQLGTFRMLMAMANIAVGLGRVGAVGLLLLAAFSSREAGPGHKGELT